MIGRHRQARREAKRCSAPEGAQTNQQVNTAAPPAKQRRSLRSILAFFISPFCQCFGGRSHAQHQPQDGMHNPNACQSRAQAIAQPCRTAQHRQKIGTGLTSESHSDVKVDVVEQDGSMLRMRSTPPFSTPNETDATALAEPGAMALTTGTSAVPAGAGISAGHSSAALVGPLTAPISPGKLSNNVTIHVLANFDVLNIELEDESRPSR